MPSRTNTNMKGVGYYDDYGNCNQVGSNRMDFYWRALFCMKIIPNLNIELGLSTILTSK